VNSFRVRRTTGLLALFFASLLVTAAAAQPVCLNVQTKSGSAHHRIAVGDELYLTFPHSVYGSQVQEHFRATSEGFQLVEVRYAESRLIEFYGHERAVEKDGWWIVRKLGPVLNILDLQVSPDSSIAIRFGAEKLRVQHDALSDGRARLALSACPRSNHG
jgi:hypothetical protein